MTTEQEVLDDLVQAITNTNRSNDDFLKVLKEGRDQDVALRDGTVVPSLTKRVVNAFSNSDYLMKADNLASVADKQEARDNLNVPTREDVITATSQATETVKGTAKIATTAIAQAGVNDTDFLTPLKLRNALNANGNAPIYACRAWVNFNGVGTVYINGSGNISSITDNGIGDYTLNFIVAQDHDRYAISSGSTEDASGYPSVPSLRMSGGSPLLKTVSAVRISNRSTITGSAFDVNNISVKVLL